MAAVDSSYLNYDSFVFKKYIALPNDTSASETLHTDYRKPYKARPMPGARAASIGQIDYYHRQPLLLDAGAQN